MPPAGLLAALTVLTGSVAFGLGSFSAHHAVAQQMTATEARFEALQAELSHAMGALRRQGVDVAAGTAGYQAPASESGRDTLGLRATFVDEIKRELQHEMGLVPVRIVRARRLSFVELYSYDNQGASRYGTAGHLGGGYFITVKHGVVALPTPGTRRDDRRVTSIRLGYRGRRIRATLVDSGEAVSEVDPGDWAIVKAAESVDLPALSIDLSYPFRFASPIFRLGNDYSKGIIPATGHVGQPTDNGLITCLTDGHPGVSGGGILDQQGALVGIPVGRMQGDFRFSFILPLRREMFRRVPTVDLATGP